MLHLIFGELRLAPPPLPFVLERICYVSEVSHLFRECKRKFGKELGVQVWEAINLVFDALPLAACIDDKVTLRSSLTVA